jgi:GNAT superfamily N-acetyltransferase
MGESDVPELRSVALGDREAIVEVMVRAFHDDPGPMMIEPDLALRDDTMQSLFRVFMTAALTEATLIQAIGNPLEGLAIWFGPEAHGPSEAALDAAVGEVGARGVSDAALVRSGAMGAEMEALHRRLMGDEAHLRLDFLVVDPACQGRGIGGRLLAAGNAVADQRELPVYLETFTAGNVRFYERRGYRVLDQHQMAVGPYSAWAMLRHPRPDPSVTLALDPDTEALPMPAVSSTGISATTTLLEERGRDRR